MLREILIPIPHNIETNTKPKYSKFDKFSIYPSKSYPIYKLVYTIYKKLSLVSEFINSIKMGSEAIGPPDNKEI